MKYSGWILFATLLLWTICGNPHRSLADIFWEESPAPWEKVDGYHYPNKSNPLDYYVMPSFPSVEECRAWAKERSTEKSDYICAIKEKTGNISNHVIYRIKVK